MITHSKIVNIGVPALLGSTLAWLALSLVRNEARLNARRVELENQLAQNLKDL